MGGRLFRAERNAFFMKARHCSVLNACGFPPLVVPIIGMVVYMKARHCPVLNACGFHLLVVPIIGMVVRR